MGGKGMNDKQYNHQYYLDHKEMLNAKHRAQYAKHPRDKKPKWDRKTWEAGYRLRNREKINDTARNRYALKYPVAKRQRK
jgi:hypothetical protein